jgi:hypothetical protein
MISSSESPHILPPSIYEFYLSKLISSFLYPGRPSSVPVSWKQEVGSPHPLKRDTHVSKARRRQDSNEMVWRARHPLADHCEHCCSPFILTTSRHWARIHRRVHIDITFSTWQADPVHSVSYQPHSFPTVSILSRSIRKTDFGHKRTLFM